jgi:hypothetical protein
MVIGGEPGVGKSTLGFTTKNSILLDFDKGHARSALTGEYREFKTWEEVVKFDYTPYDTIVIDTLGRMSDEVVFFLKRENASLYLRNDGTPSLQGFGKAKLIMRSFFDGLRKDIVIITQLKKEVDKNQEVTYLMDVQGAIKDFIRQCADAIGIITLDSKGNRVLDFNDPRFRKNTHGFAGTKPFVLPAPEKLDLYLGDLIDKCLAAKNSKGDEQDALLKQKGVILVAIGLLKSESEKETLRKKIEATFGGKAPGVRAWLLEQLAKVVVVPTDPAGESGNALPPTEQNKIQFGMDVEVATTKEYIMNAETQEDCMLVLNRITSLNFPETTKKDLKKLFAEKLLALSLKYDKATNSIIDNK